MARSRAAASFALTIGVAAATLAVMGAILAGPAITGCAGASLFACLRDRVVEPPRPSGWIDAVATEYAPPPPAAATLAGPAGTLAATAVSLLPDATPSVALEPAGGVVAVAMPAEAMSPATAALAAPSGTLVAGLAPATPPMSANVALKAPEKTRSSPIQVLKIDTEPAPPPIRYDPAFPNVVVLPAPPGGADSSITTLTVR